MLKPFTAPMRELVDQLDEDQLDALQEVADSSCTGGSDDGSDTVEIFENGYLLGLKAAGRPVFAHEVDSHGDLGTIFFLIGTEEEVIAKLQAVAATTNEEET